MAKIETEEQFDAVMARIEELLPLISDDMPQDDPLNVEYVRLGNLVADYSDEHHALGSANSLNLGAR